MCSLIKHLIKQYRRDLTAWKETLGEVLGDIKCSSIQQA